jgi:hypothetical protein
MTESVSTTACLSIRDLIDEKASNEEIHAALDELVDRACIARLAAAGLDTNELIAPPGEDHGITLSRFLREIEVDLAVLHDHIGRDARARAG